MCQFRGKVDWISILFWHYCTWLLNYYDEVRVCQSLELEQGVMLDKHSERINKLTNCNEKE